MATVEIRDDRGVRIVTLNRPEAHNCVDGQTATLLAETITAFGADARARPGRHGRRAEGLLFGGGWPP
jgi:enoyl-CoA hydratase/carnithine racemase